MDFFDESVKKFEYKYVSPVEKGMTQVYISKEEHNKLFLHEPRHWQNRFEYFISDEKVELHRFDSNLAVFLIFLLSPISLLLMGFSNWSEFVMDLKKTWNQKKYGSFCSSVFWKKRNSEVYTKFKALIK